MLINAILSMIAIYLSLGLLVTFYIGYIIFRVMRDMKSIEGKK